jgi:hypothetical protein
MKNKKSQQAMEFLMTYGWSILVVLVAIGALAYFGVLDPKQFVPNRCICSGTDGYEKLVDAETIDGVSYVECSKPSTILNDDGEWRLERDTKLFRCLNNTMKEYGGE